MSRVRTDIVTIRFRRSRITGRRIITAVVVVGSSRPCTRFLVVGRRVIFAVRCLLLNGFRIIVARRNTLIFERIRIT